MSPLHLRVVRGELQRALHRLQEALAVELERARAADLAPEIRAFLRLAELERALQVGDALVEVVAPDRELGGAPEPADRAYAQPLELVRLVRPGEVGVLGTGGLRVVVGEQGRVLVAAAARTLEPRGERAWSVARRALGTLA